jgi:outer membrane protein OmpA-like peptidoglycan-associated protein
MNYSKLSGLSILFISFMISALFFSCKSYQHLQDFALQEEIREDFDTTKQLYITSTKSIDSIDVNKLVCDIFRIEIDEYPNNLKIYARVFDSTGHFVTNMADPYKSDPAKKYWANFDETLGQIHKEYRHIDNFEVREYGDKDSIPYNIALTIDYSGSMLGVINTIFQGTELFVGMKQRFDQIALSAFTKNFTEFVPMIKDTSKILTLYRMKRNQAMADYTNVYSAIYEALYNCTQEFEGTDPKVPRVLVIFTDGDDNYSKKEIGDIIEKAKEMKIHIFTVGFGYTLDENLRFLAQYTGGKFYKAYTEKELISIFRDIYMSLRYYYYISYKPPKYWGLHKVTASLFAPGRVDTLHAYGEYETSDLPWAKVDQSFTRPIFFDFDKYDIKPENNQVIDEIVDQMLSHPRLKFEVQGHTDNVYGGHTDSTGGIEYNRILSENRAKAVMNAIIAKGIEPKRLRFRGFGMTMPIAPNNTEEGRAKNRRTQFLILAK